MNLILFLVLANCILTIVVRFYPGKLRSTKLANALTIQLSLTLLAESLGRWLNIVRPVQGNYVYSAFALVHTACILYVLNETLRKLTSRKALRGIYLVALFSVIFCLVALEYRAGINLAAIVVHFVFCLGISLFTLYKIALEPSEQPLLDKPIFYYSCGLMLYGTGMLLRFPFFWELSQFPVGKRFGQTILMTSNILFYGLLAVTTLWNLKPSAKYFQG